MDIITFVQSCLLAIALGNGLGCQSNAPEYSMGCSNDTPSLIGASRINWRIGTDDRHETFGYIGVGTLGVKDPAQRPIPQTATVTWETADGKAHSQRVDVAKKMVAPAKFSGTIFFKFMPDGSVQVVPLTYDDIHRLSYANQKYP
jgi:hypothetical protein